MSRPADAVLLHPSMALQDPNLAASIRQSLPEAALVLLDCGLPINFVPTERLVRSGRLSHALHVRTHVLDRAHAHVREYQAARTRTRTRRPCQ